MKESKLSKVISYIFLAICFLFIYAPILSIIVFSFNNQRSGVNFGGFTFKYYALLFENTKILEALETTMIVAAVATISSTIIGTLAAIGLNTLNKKLKSAIIATNDLPIINPDIVTAITLFLLFGVFSISAGYTTLIFAHIGFCVPYVLITVYPKIKSLDPSINEAARDLGANSFQILFKAILPQIYPSITAAAAIAFTMSFDDFVISYFAVGDSGIKNISIYLYTLTRGLDPSINALTVLIIIVISIIVVLNYLLSNKKRKEV